MAHDHDHGHSHAGHGHHHIDPEAGDRKVAAAVGVNLLLTVAQIAGGILSGSLALIADAIHNLSDAMSLIIAFAARKIARRPADAQMTFGYARAETVAALVNYTTLIVIGLYLIYEGVARLFDPQPIAGWTVVIVAAIALIVDLVTAALTYTMSKESMNIRAAFLHNVADAMGSVAVIVAGTLVILYDWQIIDPLVTLLIAGYILWHAFAEIGGVIRVLMLGAPPDMDSAEVLAVLRDVDGVCALHHLHLWQMEERETALQVHVVVEDSRWSEAAQIKQRLRGVLSDMGISHATLELEQATHACTDEQEIGHAAA
ncbi:MAG: cation diffusion facilitator family transporter [Celeribacter sp.]|jgi:cobalt-zinc-cadmium efflux system protein